MSHQLGILFPCFVAPFSILAQAEGNPWWIWLVVFAALAVFAGFVIWWWIYSPGAREEE